MNMMTIMEEKKDDGREKDKIPNKMDSQGGTEEENYTDSGNGNNNDQGGGSAEDCINAGIEMFRDAQYDEAESRFIWAWNIGEGIQNRLAYDWLGKTRQVASLYSRLSRMRQDCNQMDRLELYLNWSHASSSQLKDPWAMQLVHKESEEGDPKEGPLNIENPIVTPDDLAKAQNFPTIGHGFEAVWKLGQGATGAVFEVARPFGDGSNGFDIYACKRISAEKDESFRREISTLSRWKHVHAVQLVETFLSEDSQWHNIIMTPCTKFDLRDYLLEINNEIQSTASISITMMRRRRLFRWISCLSNALADIHKHRICHRDIRPANILVNGDNVILTDFGHAVSEAMIKDSRFFNAPAGISYYASPEAHMRMTCQAVPLLQASAAETYLGAEKSDVFSLGCVLFELLQALSRRFRTSPFPTVDISYANSIRDAEFMLQASTTQESRAELKEFGDRFGGQDLDCQAPGLMEELLNIVIRSMLQKLQKDRQSSREVAFMLENTIRRMQPLLLCRYCGTESYHALHYKDQQDMTSLDGDVTLERMLRDDIVDRFSLSHTPALPEDTQENPDYIYYY
jgi:serine/threonine protein kinase